MAENAYPVRNLIHTLDFTITIETYSLILGAVAECLQGLCLDKRRDVVFNIQRIILGLRATLDELGDDNTISRTLITENTPATTTVMSPTEYHVKLLLTRQTLITQVITHPVMAIPLVCHPFTNNIIVFVL